MKSGGERKHLNSLFLAEPVVKPPKLIETPVQIVDDHEKKPAKRKPRSDKIKDVKFPVTPELRAILRQKAKELNVAKRNETISNTRILTEAVYQARLFPDRFPEIVYVDTGQYMHAKPTQAIYDLVEELAFQWNVSIRRAAHRLIANYVSAGGVVIRGS